MVGITRSKVIYNMFFQISEISAFGSSMCITWSSCSSLFSTGTVIQAVAERDGCAEVKKNDNLAKRNLCADVQDKHTVA